MLQYQQLLTFIDVRFSHWFENLSDFYIDLKMWHRWKSKVVDIEAWGEIIFFIVVIIRISTKQILGIISIERDSSRWILKTPWRMKPESKWWLFKKITVWKIAPIKRVCFFRQQGFSERSEELPLTIVSMKKFFRFITMWSKKNGISWMFVGFSQKEPQILRIKLARFTKYESFFLADLNS
jgi:hypothetical protein